jgi:hypothetical protein
MKFLPQARRERCASVVNLGSLPDFQDHFDLDRHPVGQ